MGHATEGVLRRLVDEPFAVADATLSHVEGCDRCRARAETIAVRAAWSARQLAAPQPVPDVDRAWADLQGRLAQQADRHLRAVAGEPQVKAPRMPGWTRRRSASLSLRGGAVALSAMVALAGTAAGMAVGGVFSPSRVAPVKVTPSDVQAISGLVNLSNGSLGTFPTPNGTGTLPFGTLSWSSPGAPRAVPSATVARAETGVDVRLPGHRPAGVGTVERVVVQPRVTATIRFDSAAGRLAGASVVLRAGPAVGVVYGARTDGAHLPALVVLTMARPTATSAGATIGQIESFLLSRPGVPTQLVQELRLLGDITTVLPIPTPAGLTTSSVRVGDWPGVAVATPSDFASAVVWEDGSGTVRVVAGLLTERTAVGVADQLG